MQLVEQNKLDLDRDINSYLDFKIPATYPQPITLRHLMTHTAGFEEQIKDLINSEGAPISTLARTPYGAHASARLSARHHSRIFQLRSIPGRIHCGARFR